MALYKQYVDAMRRAAEQVTPEGAHPIDLIEACAIFAAALIAKNDYSETQRLVLKNHFATSFERAERAARECA